MRCGRGRKTKDFFLRGLMFVLLRENRLENLDIKCLLEKYLMLQRRTIEVPFVITPVFEAPTSEIRNRWVSNCTFKLRASLGTISGQASDFSIISGQAEVKSTIFFGVGNLLEEANIWTLRGGGAYPLLTLSGILAQHFPHSSFTYSQMSQKEVLCIRYECQDWRVEKSEESSMQEVWLVPFEQGLDNQDNPNANRGDGIQTSEIKNQLSFSVICV